MIHLADVSEFQGPIDWPTYGKSFTAVIVRAHNGYRPDKCWAQNRDGARANVVTRGWYQYLSKDSTPETQAAGFCNTLGPLLPGEFVAVDVEEGAGSQVERAQAWMTIVDKRLGTRSWLYTGQAFAQAHLGALVPFADRNVWVANYRTRPPDLRYTLWQHTDREAHAGIRSACDCSIYQGTAEQLAHLIGDEPAPEPNPAPTPEPHPTPVPFPGDHMHRVDIPNVTLDANGNGWVTVPNTQADHVVSIVPQGSYPPENGYWDLPLFGRQQRGADTIIQISEASPKAVEQVSVWIADT